MAQTIRSSVNLGPSKAGLALTAQLKDDAGTNVAATWVIVEIGSGGNYIAKAADVPDSFNGGGVRFTATGVDVVDRDGVTLSLVEGGGVLTGVTGLQWQRGGGAYPIGDLIRVGFLTYDGGTSPATLATPPTAQIRRNGVIDGAVSVTVADLGGGHYEARLTLPLLSYATTDDVQIVPHAEFTGGFVSETPYGLSLFGGTGGGGDCPTVEEIEVYLASIHGLGSWSGASPIEVAFTQPVIEIPVESPIIEMIQEASSPIEVALTQPVIEVPIESPVIEIEEES